MPVTCKPSTTSTDTSVSNPTGSSSSVGKYTINISQPDPQNPQDPQNLTYSDTNYVIDPTFNPGMLTITPAPLTITAKNQNQPYGFDTANPGTSAALTPSPDYTRYSTISSGQLFTANGDSVASVTLSTNDTLSSSHHYNAGTWTITPSAAIGSGLSNYAITYANAATGLTVVPQALGITGESAQSSKMYDGTTVDPFTATATATLSGTLSGTVLSDSTGKVPDQVSLVSGSGTANFADPNVGTHKTVTFSGYALSGADAADYALSQPTITITAAITPATGVTITASSLSETYGFGGTSAALGTTAFTISSGHLFGSDSVTAVTLSTNATLSTSSNYNAGTWTITPSGAIGSGASNYTFNYTGAPVLTVAARALTVTALNQSRAYGAADPIFTDSISGFVNGETAATGGVTGTPLLSTTAVANSPVGTYPITVQQGTLEATNYDFLILVNSGTLTVNTARLIVTADNVTRSFGTPNPQSLGWDLVREDAPQTTISAADPDPELSGAPVLSTQAGIDSAVGTYPITPTQGTLAVGNPNYVLDVSNFEPGTFTITQATLVITANPASRAYGAADPTFTDTISGFINGQTLATSGVTGAPSFTTTASSTSHVGIPTMSSPALARSSRGTTCSPSCLAH